MRHRKYMRKRFPVSGLLLSQGPGPHCTIRTTFLMMTLPIGASLLTRIAEERANVLSGIGTADKAKSKNRSKTVKSRL
jgi:hypothetical protein